MRYAGEAERGWTNPNLRLLWWLSAPSEVGILELFDFSATDEQEDAKLRTH
jgi:hypothetical protein